jgi:hypothetical protein
MGMRTTRLSHLLWFPNANVGALVGCMDGIYDNWSDKLTQQARLQLRGLLIAKCFDVLALGLLD